VAINNDFGVTYKCAKLSEGEVTAKIKIKS